MRKLRDISDVLDQLAGKFTVDDDCWEWTAAKDRHGYGSVQGIEGRLNGAHRVIYELLNGPIPDGLYIDHLCRNPGCVRPSHLEPVTNRVNVMRGQSPAARQARRTHCDYGHEFSLENTYRVPSDPGRRRCRICMNKRRDNKKKLQNS